MNTMIRKNKIIPVILAGGLGTRLRIIMNEMPKVLAPVMGRPFITIILDQLITAKFNEVLICTGYMGDKVKKSIGKFYKNIKIKFSDETDLLGTGGAVINALKLLPKKTYAIMVMNGDSYLDIELNKYIDWFIGAKIDCSLTLKNVKDTSRYGSVDIDNNKKVIAFYEKKINSSHGWVNAGIYLFKKSIFDDYNEGDKISIEKDILPQLTEKNFYGYECDGEFIDIGTPESYAMAEAFFKKKLF